MSDADASPTKRESRASFRDLDGENGPTPLPGDPESKSTPTLGLPRPHRGDSVDLDGNEAGELVLCVDDAGELVLCVEATLSSRDVRASAAGGLQQAGFKAASAPSGSLKIASAFLRICSV